MTPENLALTKEYVDFRDSTVDQDSALFTSAIKFGEARLSESVFNTVYYQAIGLFILHHFELKKILAENGTSQAGTIQSEKEDLLEVKMNISSSNKKGNDDYDRTGYGRELNTLSREKISGRTFMNSRMLVVN